MLRFRNSFHNVEPIGHLMLDGDRGEASSGLKESLRRIG
jgi:hypothetical protein